MNFGKAKGGGRRRSARSDVPVLGTLSTITSDYRVGLVNLSSTGARLSAPDLPAEGAALQGLPVATAYRVADRVARDGADDGERDDAGEADLSLLREQPAEHEGGLAREHEP